VHLLRCGQLTVAEKDAGPAGDEGGPRLTAPDVIRPGPLISLRCNNSGHLTTLNPGVRPGPGLIGLVPRRVVHHLNHVSVGVPEEAGHFAVTHPGFPLKGDAHTGQIG
jgi:hypothetical protein